MKIRKALENDATNMALIFNTYIGKSHMVVTPRQEAEFIELIHHPRVCTLIVLDIFGGIVGYAYVKPYSDRGGYAGAGEVSIFLWEGRTGEGFGQKLYDLLLPAAEALGYHHLTAKIWTENTGSIRFHERNGFRTVGIQHGIGKSGGRRVDVTIMERV
ncbi:GNAT family N-acetyltransferase [Neolewinella agarilytica]|uniref:Phosphinothricin acetyltransferase n=1 Tax=Neolewinella agarilytica TaxID=478744 RepID=A0A1H9JZT7_9BACT|nr:GNAT family N-acetyltransferase [Neolewinella agarilytica]SEQ92173.1 phosphinothricin acetyltransferase [Neolewinella agarilytica]